MRSGIIFTNYPVPFEDGTIRSLRTATFLIFDKTYGGILFDTGSTYDSEVLINSIYEISGLRADEIRWIFNTHIHPDHVGNNSLFKNATIVYSKRDRLFYDELQEAAFSDIDFLEHLHNVCPGYRGVINRFDSEKIRLSLTLHYNHERLGLKNSTKIIEDNPDIPHFITPVPLFGHTFYHTGFLIKRKIDFLVSGDACTSRFIYKGDDSKRLGEPHVDFTDYFKSLETVRNFTGVIVPGHDNPFHSSTLQRVKPDELELLALPI